MAKRNLTIYLDKCNQELELSYLQIRRAVGWLGIILPVSVSLGTYIFSRCGHLLDSISNYYYTVMGNTFTGILCGVALFLYSYKGFDNWDRISSNIASIFALGVAFFPMNVERAACMSGDCEVVYRAAQPWRDTVHYISAAGLFFTLACMSLFLFVKTHKDKRPTARKLQRNIIYRACGSVMLLSMLLTFCFQKGYLPKFPHATFVMETVMLWAFGFSWLVKGETLLTD